METNRIWSENIIATLLSLGIEEFCVAPGGQSTALVAALDSFNIKPTIHYDERGLAYYALGWGKNRGVPAAIITTSGTAVGNLMPAVMEAFHAREPLLLITADLSWENTSIGNNQSCKQGNLFSEYTRWNFDFPAPSETPDLNALTRLLKNAVLQSIGSPSGPVHLNFRFKSPLFSEQSGQLPEVKKQNLYRTKLAPSEDALSVLCQEIIESEKGVVVLGQMPNWINRKPILDFLDFLKWPVLTDVLSGFRGEEKFCSKFPIYLTDDEIRKRLKPDFILHLGGDLVLRPPEEPYQRGVHKYLGLEGVKRVLVNENISLQDPFLNIDLQIRSSVDLFCEVMLKKILSSTKSDLLADYEELEQKAIIELTQYGELSALEQLLSKLDAEDTIFVGNSLPLRELDSLLDRRVNNVVSAHGLKGIDGIVALAAGYKAAGTQALTLILGDISFLYDINSLPLLAKTKVSVFVLNNNGGQIFSYVDCKNTPCFERSFLNPHGMDFKNISRQFGLDYYCPQDLDSLKQALLLIPNSHRSSLIEIKSNSSILHEEQLLLFSNAIKRLKS